MIIQLVSLCHAISHLQLAINDIPETIDPRINEAIQWIEHAEKLLKSVRNEEEDRRKNRRLID